MPWELGVLTGSLGVGETRESEDESPCPLPSALWLDGPLSIARCLRGGAEVARAAATVWWASLCGCASEVDFDVVEDNPNVAEVPGEADELLAMAQAAEAQSHSSNELYG